MSMFWPHDGEALRGNTLDQFLIWCSEAAVEEHGQTFAQSIAAAVKQGRITEAVAAAAMKEEN